MLVQAGYARPGQSSRQLLDSFSLEVILDLAYGLLVKDREPKDRKKFDEMLFAPDPSEETHEEYMARRKAEILEMTSQIGGPVRGRGTT